MKPLGRRKVKFPSKTDCHPTKGYINWWEDMDDPKKSREREETRKHIENEVDESER